MRDPSDTRDIGPRAGSPLWIHITAVTIAGGIVFAIAMAHLSSSQVSLGSLIGKPLFWVLTAMVVLSDVWPIVTPGRSSVEAPVASVTFSLAALIVWGFPIAVLIRVASTVGVGIAERKARSEEHTSELQSRRDLVCRLLL